MYHLTIVLALLFFSTTMAQEDDTVGGNLTINNAPAPGPCPKIFSRLLDCNTTQYNGRWYVAFLSYTADQVRQLQCETIDTEFDEQGNYKNYLHTIQNGEVKTAISKSTKIPGEPGVFTFTVGQPEDGPEFKNAVFFMDTEMFIIWSSICYTPNTQHQQIVLVMFRNLSWVRDKSPQMKRAVKIIEEAGYNVTLQRVRHPQTCVYPPERKSE